MWDYLLPSLSGENLVSRLLLRLLLTRDITDLRIEELKRTTIRPRRSEERGRAPSGPFPIEELRRTPSDIGPASSSKIFQPLVQAQNVCPTCIEIFQQFHDVWLAKKSLKWTQYQTLSSAAESAAAGCHLCKLVVRALGSLDSSFSHISLNLTIQSNWLSVDAQSPGQLDQDISGLVYVIETVRAFEDLSYLY